MAWYAPHPDGQWPGPDGRVPDAHRAYAEPGSALEAALVAHGHVVVAAPGQPAPAPVDEQPVDEAAPPRPARRTR